MKLVQLMFHSLPQNEINNNKKMPVVEQIKYSKCKKIGRPVLVSQQSHTYNNQDPT